LAYTPGQRLAAAAAEAVTTFGFGLTTRHARLGCRWDLAGPLDAALRSDGPLIVAAWHQDVLAFFHYLAVYTHLQRKRRPVMMSSRSFDGEVTERIMRPFGFDFVRGSRGKKGARAALRGLLRAAGQGRDIVLIADGPLPPAYRMQPGPVYLARESGLPLYVARAWVRPQLVLSRTWFRMAVPLPGCRVAMCSAGPLDVSGNLEEARERAEKTLHRLGIDADARLYPGVAV
jgi:lysophospholipid acyltransferase (LPLAT)-like uncharacterized protein